MVVRSEDFFFGAVALPLIGFGLGGVAAGSAAAAWQSSIGSVAAVLQSLGATGLGIFLFGSVGSALGLLSTIAVKLGWCTCDYKANNN